nr:HutD family protein [Dyella sp. ASV21]
MHGKSCADGSAIITEIACGPHNDDWQWRLTMIGADEQVAFPPHADMRRQFVPLDAPVEISFPDGRTQQLDRFAIAYFDDANAPEAFRAASPTRTVNLKLRNQAQGELLARPLRGTMVLLAPQGWRWFFLLLSGHADIYADHRSQAVSPNDMIWIDPIPGHPVRIEGDGELVLARLPSH